MYQSRRKMPLPGALLLFTAALLCLLLAAMGLSQLTGKGSSSLRSHLELGQRYLDELNYDAAVIEFTNAINIDDRSVPAYVGRGQAYLGLEEYPQAEQDFTVVIENLDSENVDAYVGRAQAYIGQGEADKALEDISMAEENGLPQEEADKLRQQAENGPSSTVGADGETTRRVLTAGDVTWILEPTYNYLDITPLHTDHSSIYAWSTEDISPLPQLYQATVFLNDFDKPESDVIDMSTMTTLSQLTSNAYAFYPFIVPEQMPYSEVTSAHLCLGDAYLNGFLSLPDNWAGGSVTYGAMMDIGYSASAVYDPSTSELFAEGHNTAGGPPYYTVYPFADVSSNFAKPVPVYQWQLSAYYQPGTDVHYVLPESADSVPVPCITVFNEPLDSVFAFVSPDGTLLTDFVYEDTVDYSCGIAAAKRNGKWGYLDETGTPVTGFIYDGIWNNSTMDTDSKAFPCTCDTMVVSQNGQMGLLYRDGSVLLDFGEFEDLAPAYNDQLWAMQDGAWGLLDLKGIKAKAGVPTD